MIKFFIASPDYVPEPLDGFEDFDSYTEAKIALEEDYDNEGCIYKIEYTITKVEA